MPARQEPTPATAARVSGCNAGGLAVAVAHTETSQASLTALGELPIRRSFDLQIATTSLTEWATDDDPAGGGPPAWSFARWTLVRLNDAAHLEGMPA